MESALLTVFAMVFDVHLLKRILTCINIDINKKIKINLSWDCKKNEHRKHCKKMKLPPKIS